MRFYTPQPSLRKVVCCWQAEVLNPKEVWPAVLGYSFQQGSLPGGTIVIWIGSIFTPYIFKINICLNNKKAVTIHSRFEGTINRAELQHRFIPDILMWVQGGDTEKISVTE